MHFSVKNDFLKSFFEKYLYYSKFFCTFAADFKTLTSIASTSRIRFILITRI